MFWNGEWRRRQSFISFFYKYFFLNIQVSKELIFLFLMIDLYPLILSVEIVFGGFSIVDSILKTCTAAKTQFTQFNPSTDTSSHHLGVSEVFFAKISPTMIKIIHDICYWRVISHTMCNFTLFCREAICVSNLRTFECKFFRLQKVSV